MLRALYITLMFAIWPASAHAGCPEFFSGLVPQSVRNDRAMGNYINILNRRFRSNEEKRAWLEETVSIELERLGFRVPQRVNTFGINASNYLTRKKWDHRYALTHSGMPAALEEIEKAGYKLQVSANLVEKRNLGAYDWYDKTIMIMPHTDWPTFQHELQHMRNSQLKIHLGPNFYVDSPGLSAREAKTIAQAKALAAKKFSDKAIDETLAVSAEIKALRKIGYTPWSRPVYEARLYAWDFQIRSLEVAQKSGRATSRDIARLRRLKIKRKILHPAFVRSALAASGFTAIYYNEELERFITRTKDGLWSYFE